jgi:CRP-like cAMP-binding protein
MERSAVIQPTIAVTILQLGLAKIRCCDNGGPMRGEGNRLLHLFGDAARDQLDRAVTVQLSARDVLQDAGMPALHVYFPIDAVISLISTTENGASVEIGLIGREGMIGLAGVLGTVEGGTSAIVQVSGTAVRVPTASLKAVRLANASVRKAIDLYIEAICSDSASRCVQSSPPASPAPCPMVAWRPRSNPRE